MSLTATEVGPAALPEEVRLKMQTGSLMPTMTIPDEGINFTSIVTSLERDLILKCLEKTGGNKRQAARLLNLSRTTFIDKLQRLNVDNIAQTA
jgi:DNA-binding NtrC family response regulator